MMRGERTWAVAVRTPEGDIEVVTHEAPTWASAGRRSRSFRGVMALGESHGARLQGADVVGRTADPRRGADLEQGDGLDDRRRARASSSAIFIVLPALAANGIGNVFGLDGLLVPRRRGRDPPRRSSSATSLLIGLLPDIKRVFQYHGAEHKAIAAYENDVEVTPESAQRFTTAARALRHQLPAHRDGRHDRRVLVRRPARAAAAHRVPHRADPAHRGARATRSSASPPGTWTGAWVRVLMKPGPAAAALTTREPTLDQLEVAIASLRAVMTAEQLAEVEARSTKRAPGAPVPPRPAAAGA